MEQAIASGTTAGSMYWGRFDADRVKKTSMATAIRMAKRRAAPFIVSSRQHRLNSGSIATISTLQGARAHRNVSG